MSQKLQKKVYAFVTFTNSKEKSIEIWSVTDAKIEITKFHGEIFFNEACDFLLEMKKKNFEGIFFDLFEHQNRGFLIKLRKDFAEFCQNKKFLCRWIFRDILFSTMLIYLSDENFKTEDSVITLWVKNDKYVFHQYHDGYLTQLNRIKIDDIRFEKKFDEIFKFKEPKFVVMGSTTVLKEVKGQLKAKKVKMIKNTFMQCLQKSASYLLNEMLRSQKSRWNFKIQHFNSFNIEVKSGPKEFSISSTSIDSLPYQDHLDLPKGITNIHGSTSLHFGRHISFINSTQTTVEIDEDGFIHFVFPKIFAQYCFGSRSLKLISYKNVAYMEDFVYITTAADPDLKVLEAWRIINCRLIKQEFSGANLLKDLEKYLLKMKKISLDAIILNLYQHSDSEFLCFARQYFKSFCERQELPFKFIYHESLFISILLLKSKINLMSKTPTTITMGYTLNEDFKLIKIKASSDNIKIIEKFESFSEDSNVQDVFYSMCNMCQADHLILSIEKDHPLKLLFGLFMLNRNMPNIIEKNFEECFTTTSKEFFLQIFNNKICKWNIIIPGIPEINAENECHYINLITDDDILKYPCSKILSIPKNTLRLNIERNFGEGYSVEYSKIEKVSIDIAEDGFSQIYFPLKFAAFDGNSFIYKEFAKKLNEKVINRKPVIIFPEDIAILFVFENGAYAPIEIDGRKELRKVISFAKDDPVFGNSAMDFRINEDEDFVVYDIMKILKMDPKTLVKNNNWGFKIVRHQNYPILFEFQTTNGLTHAPPSFLLAMILKQLAKAYRKKTGHKLKDVMVPDIYQNQFSLKHIKEAFTLLNMKYNVFKL